MGTMIGLALRDVSIADVERIAPAAEAAGMGTILFPETGHVTAINSRGRDPFLCAEAALRTTQHLRAGTGVAASTIRSARSTTLTAATINEQSGGRFVLGLGVSHRPGVEALGLPFPSSPLRHLRDYITEVRDTPVAYGRGFPVLIAALGPKMVALAATVGDGLVMNYVSPRTAAQSRDRFASERRANAPEAQHFALVRCGAEQSVLADATSYRDQLPNYAQHFAASGYEDLHDLVAQTCAPANPVKVRERANAYAAEHVVPLIYPSGMTCGEILTLLNHLTSG
jgi:alkanesulfonate monooxygenase SsuD/methylene tetrahydromethanopterin reductase-like flavin-dependent oxidoreductase (luciferase family)